jgi:hypothetical protein
LLVRHSLNLNSAIEEQLTLGNNQTQIKVTPTPAPPSQQPVMNDLDFLWDPVPTKPTVTRANSTPHYTKPNTSTSTMNDLSDIFGGLPGATAPAPAPVSVAPHKKDSRSKSLSSATSPFDDLDFVDENKKSKKEKRDKRVSLGPGTTPPPKDVMSTFEEEDDSKKLDRKKSDKQLKKVMPVEITCN